MAGVPYNPGGGSGGHGSTGAGGGGGGGGGFGSAPAIKRGRGGNNRPGQRTGNPLVDAMLGLLGGGGGAGGGGGSYSPGFNGAAARAAANQAYEGALGNTRNVYGQIQTEVKNRAPMIQAGYDQATAAVAADAKARAEADAARNQEADTRNATTAQALGLGQVSTGPTQADALMQAGQNALQQQATAWQGSNAAQAQLELARNASTGDVFRYGQTQAEGSLASTLQQALAQIAGMEASNRGGYSGGGGGGGGGGASTKDQFNVLKQLQIYDIAQKKLAQQNRLAQASNQLKLQLAALR